MTNPKVKNNSNIANSTRASAAKTKRPSSHSHNNNNNNPRSARFATSPSKPPRPSSLASYLLNPFLTLINFLFSSFLPTTLTALSLSSSFTSFSKGSKTKKQSKNDEFLTSSFPTSLSTTSPPPSSSSTSFLNFFSPSNSHQIFGLDCEMVGCGRGGITSVLARVTLVRRKESAPALTTSSSSHSYDPNHYYSVYDRIVRPSKSVTDYRTKYSGITKEILSNGIEGIADVVSFDRCRDEVSRLISGHIVVGHALENDFDALRLRHPAGLTRDTAQYIPFMSVYGKSLRQRKLKYLVEEKLNARIQESEGSSQGHSSMEDASATLALYYSVNLDWEKSLEHGVTSTATASVISSSYSASSESPITSSHFDPLTIILDGCNLPVGLRYEDDENSETPSPKYTLMTKLSDDVDSPSHKNSTSSRKFEYIDWIPSLQALIVQGPVPVKKVVIYFDGAHYKNNKNSRLASACISEKLELVVTHVDVEADDKIVDDCIALASDQSETENENEEGKIVTVDEMISLLNEFGIDLPYYFIIRRIAGGTRTHKKLFNRLNLRRGEGEGAACLCSLTLRLKRWSLAMARRIKADKGTGRLIEIKRMRAEKLKCVVATDDVLLSDRVAKEGGLVLSSKQLFELV